MLQNALHPTHAEPAAPAAGLHTSGAQGAALWLRWWWWTITADLRAG